MTDSLHPRARRSDFAGMNATIVRELADYELEVRFGWSHETWIWRRCSGHRGMGAFYEQVRRIA